MSCCPGSTSDTCLAPLVVAADQPYHPTQWLAEVLGSAEFKYGGLVGIRILRVLALAILVAAVYLTARQFASQRAAGVVTLLVTFGTSAAWGERPQVAGLVLYAVVVLLRVRAERSQAVPWLTVPVHWVWACLHGSWIVGLSTGVVMTGPDQPSASSRPSPAGLRQRAVNGCHRSDVSRACAPDRAVSGWRGRQPRCERMATAGAG